MVKLRTRMTESGVLYVPKEVRDAFGRELVIVPNSCAVVMFPRGLKYEHVLTSLKIIVADIEHQLAMEREKRGEKTGGGGWDA